MTTEIAEREFARRPMGVSAGLIAAVLFGLSTPASKLLLADISPLMLAGLLYAGAALALWISMLLRPRTHQVDAGLRRTDLPKLAVVVVCGGIAAPIAFAQRVVTGFSGCRIATDEPRRTFHVIARTARIR